MYKNTFFVNIILFVIIKNIEGQFPYMVICFPLNELLYTFSTVINLLDNIYFLNV